MVLVDLIKSDLLRLYPQGNQQIGRPTIMFAILNPRAWPGVSVRVAKVFYMNKITRPLGMVVSWLATFLFGFECTPRCNIGRGLLIPHSHGTVIGAAEIGENVTVFQGVTLGAKFADFGFTESQRPKIGNDVIIGAGAKVLGGIVVGDGAVIAANSLVLDDVAANSRVMGVPARPIVA